MRNKILVMFLLAVSAVIILPTEGSAKTSDSKTTVEVTKTEPVAQRRNRGWQRRNDRRMRRDYRQMRRDNRRARMIRQYYYRNGRRYSRMVRVY